jgi:hypothetical protein
MTISYTRTFSHTDWVDNVDRVQAGGDNGFNGRFHSLEEQFDTISGVVSQVNDQFGAQATQISGLQQQISAFGIAVARAVSVAPVLTTIGLDGWSFDSGRASKPPGATIAMGGVPVTLPVGGQITAFRACGINRGTGDLQILLRANKVDGSHNGSVVGMVVTGQPNASDFDLTKNPVDGSASDVIDSETCYFIDASLDGAGANDLVSLTGFQVLYQAR